MPSESTSRAKAPPLAAIEYAAHVRQRAPYIIDGVGGPGDVVEFFGDEGGGKTRLVTGLAEHVSTGRRQWGPFRILRPGNVLIIPTDPPPASVGRFIDELKEFGTDLGGIYMPHPENIPLYRVVGTNRVIVEHPCPAPSNCALVIIDTWTALISADGEHQRVYNETVIRAVIRQLRNDYPTALLVVLNHTTGGDFGSTSLSPGLRRAAETRYRVVPPPMQSRDEVGRWLKPGALSGEGKFSRSDRLPRKVALQWDEGCPYPIPTIENLSPALLVAMWPDVPGCTTDHPSQRAALKELADAASVSFEALRSIQRRQPNPRLATLSKDE